MAYVGLEEKLYQILAATKRNFEITPIILGGITGSGGGIEGRPGGFIGQLPQTLITYDLSESSTSGTAGSPSLLDNLNHIRHRLSYLELSGTGGIESIENNDILIGSGITVLDFSDDFIVTINPSGEANIDLNSSGSLDDIYVNTSGDAMTGHLHIYGSQDVQQLRVRANNTQTSSIVDIRDSSNNTVMQTTNAGETFVSSLNVGNDINISNTGIITNSVDGDVDFDDNIKFVSSGKEINFNDDITITHQATSTNLLIDGIDINATYPRGIQIDTASVSGDYSANSLFVTATHSHANTLSVYGVHSRLWFGLAGTATWGAAMVANLANISTGTVTTGIGLYVLVQNTSTGTLSTGIGVLVGSPSNSGTYTNYYAISISASNGVATNEYGLYVNNMGDYAIYTNLGKSRFGDSLHLVGSSGWLSIGTETQTNYRAINVANPTLSTTFSAGAGLFMDVNFSPSGASHNVYGAYYDVTGDTTTYTISGAYGIRVVNVGKSGGGTITTSYGMYIDSVSSGSTNYALYTGAGLNRLGDRLQVVGSQDIVQLVVNANATQTSNLAEFYHSGGGALVLINNSAERLTIRKQSVGSSITLFTTQNDDLSNNVTIGSDLNRHSSLAMYHAGTLKVAFSSYAESYINNLNFSASGGLAVGTADANGWGILVEEATNGALAVNGNIQITNQSIGSSNPTIQKYYSGTLYYNEFMDASWYINMASREDSTGGFIWSVNGTSPIEVMRLDYNKRVTVGGVAGTVAKFKVNGTADETIVGIKGYSTQNKHLLLVENNAGDDLFAVTASGVGLFGTGVAQTNVGDIQIEGFITFKEDGSDPTADVDYGKIWTKSDNALYFQDGDGTTHTIDMDGGGGSYVNTSGDLMTGSLVIDTNSIQALVVEDSGGERSVLEVDTTNAIVNVHDTLRMNHDTLRDYEIGHTTDNALYVRPLDSSINNIVSLFTQDGDGTDYNSLNIYGVGTPTSLANTEKLAIQATSANSYLIHTVAAGTGTVRPLILYTGSNSNQLYLDTDGQVGIGTVPTANFHVYGSGAVFETIQSTDNQAYLRLQGATLGQVYNVTGDLYVTNNSASGSLIFRTGTSTERARFLSSGEFGIGVTPTAKLHVKGTTDEVQVQIEANATQTNNVILVKDSASANIMSLTDGGQLNLYSTTFPQFRFAATQTWGLGDSGGNFFIKNTTASTGGIYFRRSDNVDVFVIDFTNNKAATNADMQVGDDLIFASAGADINWNSSDVILRHNDATNTAKLSLLNIAHSSSYKRGLALYTSKTTTGYASFDNFSSGNVNVADSTGHYGDRTQVYSTLTSGTNVWLVATSPLAYNNAGGTVSNLFAIYPSVQNTGAGIVTLAYTINVAALINSGGGTISTYRGIQINSSNSNATNDAGLYVGVFDDFSLYTTTGVVRFGDEVRMSTYASINTETTYSNTAVHIGGTVNNAGAGVHGIYMGAITLAPASGATAYGIYQLATVDTTAGTVANAYGMYIATMLKTGANPITTAWGIRVGDVTVGGTTNYSLYTGLGTVYHGDFMRLWGSQDAIQMSVSAYSGQTVSIFTIQNSSGTVLSQFDANGWLGIAGTTSPTARLSIYGSNVDLVHFNNANAGIGHAGSGSIIQWVETNSFWALADAARTGTQIVRVNMDTRHMIIGDVSGDAKLTVNGVADEVQLQVQGNSTQTSSLVVLEDDVGVQQVGITASGHIAIDDVVYNNATLAIARDLYNIGGSTYGIYFNQTQKPSTGNSSFGIFEQLYTDTSLGNISESTALRLAVQKLGSNTISTMYGIWMQSVTGGTNNYAIYTQGGEHRFGDVVRVTDALEDFEGIIIENTQAHSVNNSVIETHSLKNLSGGQVNALQIISSLPSGIASSEDSYVNFDGLVNGVAKSFLEFDGANQTIILNDDGADLDFTYKSNGGGNALFVNAGTSYVGIGTNNPGTTLHVNGGMTLKAGYTTSTPYGLSAIDHFLAVDASGGNKVVELTSNTGSLAGRIYTIKKIDSSSNTVTIDPNGSQTIDGATTYVLSAQYDSVTIIGATSSASDAWHIIATV